MEACFHDHSAFHSLNCTFDSAVLLPRKETELLRTLGHLFSLIIILCLLLCAASDIIPKVSATSSMAASEACVEFIRKMEGFSSKPYYEYKQHTVVYGTKSPTDKYFEYYNNGISKEDADLLLREAIAGIENTIYLKLIKPYNLTFTQNQFDALVSFSFNIGTAWMSYDSTLRSALLNQASDDQFVYAFSLYSTAGGVYSSGLINRRLCEADMFLNGAYSQKPSDAYGYVLYEPNGGSLTYQVQGFICEDRPAPVADAVRREDVFLGWYTDVTGGTWVEKLSRELNGKTLFARWQSTEQKEEHDSPSVVITVTGDVVNIRKGPGTNYGIAKQVYQKDVLLLSHTTELSGRKWGKVNNGWICLEYTDYSDLINGSDNSEEGSNQESSGEEEVSDNIPAKPEDEKPAESQEIVTGIVCVNDLLRIRSGPGTTYATVGYLTNGKIVEIHRQQTVGSMVWGQISRGWVSMDYIETDRPATDSTVDTETDNATEDNTVDTETDNSTEDNTVDTETDDSQKNETSQDKDTSVLPAAVDGIIIADALRVRSGPGTEYSIVSFYYQNESVTVFERVSVDSADWGKTSRGWINLDYFVPHSSDKDSPSSADIGKKTVIGDCLRVRRETSTDSRIAALLYYGDQVTVLETKTVDGTVWGRINQGWICMDYVE